MTGQRFETIKRGRMSPEEKAEIERLCETLKNPTPSTIARRLNRHPATVKWHMLTHGLWDVPPQRAPRPYTTKNGQTRNPWMPEHDRRLLALELAGEGSANTIWRDIAETLTREFGVPRNQHSARIRAIMLAAGGVEE